MWAVVLSKTVTSEDISGRGGTSPQIVYNPNCIYQWVQHTLPLSRLWLHALPHNHPLHRIVSQLELLE